jgi:hypothetical protein
MTQEAPRIAGPVQQPAAPRETLLNHLGFANGLLVQGNAHGFDNRVLLALSAAPTWHRNN